MKLDRRILVVATDSFQIPAMKATGLPLVRIIYYYLDRVFSEKSRIAFYVLNSEKNSQFLRFPHVTHILLLHGESDKRASANRISGCFDVLVCSRRSGGRTV